MVYRPFRHNPLTEVYCSSVPLTTATYKMRNAKLQKCEIVNVKV